MGGVHRGVEKRKTLLRFWLEIFDMVIIMEWKEGDGGGGGGGGDWWMDGWMDGWIVGWVEIVSGCVDLE
ncbi:unnamed protein product [Prunus armeniaca]